MPEVGSSDLPGSRVRAVNCRRLRTGVHRRATRRSSGPARADHRREWERKPARLHLALGCAVLALGLPVRAANLLTQNPGFDAGAAGWSWAGGAEVVATSDPDDNPFARVPDGGLVFLYQKVTTPAPAFSVSFDFFTGLMNPAYPSPGSFPDTAFGTVYSGATDAGLAPELFKSDGAFDLLTYDATNGLRGTPSSATVSASSARPGWRRFEGTFAGIPGQPFLALTFQNLDGNGVRGDSALLVDNVFLMAVPAPIPEPTSGLTAALGCSLVAAWAFWRRRRVRKTAR